MLNPKVTVVISAGQSRNPEKRQLEQSVAEGAIALDGVAVVRIPHLYDLQANGESFQTLRQINTHLVVLSWLFDRAAHWVLDRNGVRGQVGATQLRYGDEDQEEETDEPSAEDEQDRERVIDQQQLPDRKIFSLDFRASKDPAEFIDEIRRIVELVSQPASDSAEPAIQVSGGSVAEGDSDQAQQSAQPVPLTFDLLERFAKPTNDTYLGSNARPQQTEPLMTLFGEKNHLSIDEHPSRRWYPVIDYSRCTNCMECIDFCLFGVYGIDRQETILVEQADNCRKGCPACSRVCPENAIIFPQHKTPAIAGAPVGNDGLKIDLSKLFGAAENDEDPVLVAARERDEQLLLAGREAVGLEVGIRRRIEEKKASSSSNGKPDELDDLLDQLDSFDL